MLDLTNWNEFRKCLVQSGFRSRRMITSENALIYTYVLWLIGRHDLGIDLKTLRGTIAGAVLHGSHNGSLYLVTRKPDRIGSWSSRRIYNRDGERILRRARSHCCGQFHSRLLGKSHYQIDLRPRHLVLQPCRDRAALNLLDAELLFSSLRICELLDPTVTSPRSIQRHHSFPRAFLEGRGVTGIRQVNAIANMAFVDWPENLAISADDPNEYWPKMVQVVPKDRMERQIYWHALPVGWEQLDYQVFLERRRQLIAEVVRVELQLCQLKEVLRGYPRT